MSVLKDGTEYGAIGWANRVHGRDGEHTSLSTTDDAGRQLYGRRGSCFIILVPTVPFSTVIEVQLSIGAVTDQRIDPS